MSFKQQVKVRVLSKKKQLGISNLISHLNVKLSDHPALGSRAGRWTVFLPFSGVMPQTSHLESFSIHCNCGEKPSLELWPKLEPFCQGTQGAEEVWCSGWKCNVPADSTEVRGWWISSAESVLSVLQEGANYRDSAILPLEEKGSKLCAVWFSPSSGDLGSLLTSLITLCNTVLTG